MPIYVIYKYVHMYLYRYHLTHRELPPLKDKQMNMNGKENLHLQRSLVTDDLYYFCSDQGPGMDNIRTRATAVPVPL